MSVTEPEMDDWAALWAGEPTQAEREDVHAIATGVSRRARLFDHADIIVAAIVTVGVLLALLWRPSSVTMAVGLIAGAGLFWPCWKRYQLKAEIDELVGVADRSRLLELQRRRTATELQRSQLALLASPLAMLLFAMLTHSVEQGGTLTGFYHMLSEALTDMPVGPIVIATMLTLLVQQARLVSRLRSQLSEMDRLSGQYRDETRLDQAALSTLVSG